MKYRAYSTRPEAAGARFSGEARKGIARQQRPIPDKTSIAMTMKAGFWT